MVQEGESTNREKFQPACQIQNVKERQIRRTQAKKLFPEWSGSAPDFFSGFAD